jgi:transposase
MVPKKPTKAKLRATQQKFLAAYQQTLRIKEAAEAAGVDRSCHYQWMQADNGYRDAFASAHESGVETVEAEVRRRAVDGVRRKLFHAGSPVLDAETGEQAVEVEYSDRLLLALLKRHSPAWADASQITGTLAVEHSGQLQAIAGQIHADPDYVEYLRRRACETLDHTSGDGDELQSRPVETR